MALSAIWGRCHPLLASSLIFLAASGLTLGMAIVNRGAGIPVYCAAPVRDFGMVSPKTQLSHIFEVRNLSQHVVDQVTVATKCSKCSSATVSGRTLPAGGKLQVKVVAEAGTAAGAVQRDFILVWRLQGEQEPHQTLLAVKANVAN